MNDIFISYARKDKEKAQNLASLLEEQGFSIWWDVEIRAGESFDNVIKEAIDNSKCVIVLWTNNSIDRDYVLGEASEGKERNILIPVLLENVRIPIAFKRTHSIDLSNWDEKSIDNEFNNLIENINLLVNSPGKSKGAQLPSQSPDNKSIKTKKTKLKRSLTNNNYFKVFLLLSVLITIVFLYQRSMKNQYSCNSKLVGFVIKDDKKVKDVIVELLDSNNEVIETAKIRNGYKFNVGCHEIYKLRAIKKGNNSSLVSITTEGLNETAYSKNIYLSDCPELSITPVYFDFDKSYIRPDAEIILNNLAEQLFSFPDINIKIEAHASRNDFVNETGDNVKGEEKQKYLLKFSKYRANTIKDYLIDRGVSPDRIIETIGYGNLKPIIQKELMSEEEHQVNRRTIITPICE